MFIVVEILDITHKKYMPVYSHTSPYCGTCLLCWRVETSHIRDICLYMVTPAYNVAHVYCGGTSPLVAASMSTRHIGQRLLVQSHWSTHSTWNKCIHGNRLQHNI